MRYNKVEILEEGQDANEKTDCYYLNFTNNIYWNVCIQGKSNSQ